MDFRAQCIGLRHMSDVNTRYFGVSFTTVPLEALVQ